VRRGGWAALAAAAVLGGCGGGGDEPGPAKIETKADYIAAGDRICRERDERSVKLTQPGEGQATTAGLALELADVYTDSINRLQALPLPPGAARPGAERYAMAVANLRRPAQQMKETARALSAATTEADIKRLAGRLQINVNSIQAINDLADLHARSYGFKICGKQQPAAPIT
jgi:hypothetical protein